MSGGAGGANRIDQRLAAAAADGKGAILPYVTGGFPNLEATAEWIRRFDALGVAGVEIGFPYSDSIADGPVIQESFHRALAGGLRIQELLDLVCSVRSGVDVALMAMVSFAIVRRTGTEAFVRRAAECGFDGMIVPDLPCEEADEVANECDAQGMRHVMLVAPTTPPARAEQIARRSRGFVYLVAASGVTGERDHVPGGLGARVLHLRSTGRKPVCVGFGISSVEQVRQVCAVADGAIVGSAIVRRITEGLDAGEPVETIIETVSGFVGQLLEVSSCPRGGMASRAPLTH